MYFLRNTTLVGLVSLSLVLSSCGGGDEATDEPMEVNPAGTHTQYVMSSLKVPGNQSQSSASALDLDGDGFDDNALGGLLGSLADTADLDLQTGIDEQLAEAKFSILISVKATDLVNANGVGSYFLFGENPSPAACAGDDGSDCGKHLAGGASFDVSASSPKDAELRGLLAGGVLKGGPGKISIQLPLGDVAPLTLNLIAARVEADVSADGLSAGTLAGAITSTDIDEDLMPSIQTLVADLINETCTPVDGDCGCEDNSSGASVLDFFDENDDCEVPLQELMDNSLISATLRNPDLDLLDASGNPGSDGVNDSLSIGVAFTAVSATFPLPAAIQ